MTLQKIRRKPDGLTRQVSWCQRVADLVTRGVNNCEQSDHRGLCLFLGVRPRNAPRAPRSLGNRCDNHVPSYCAPTISVAILGKGRVGVRIEPEGRIAPPFTGRGDTA